MNGVQTRFKCKLDVKRCKRFVFPPSSLLPRSNALKTKAIRYFQTDRTLTRIVSPPLLAGRLNAQGNAVNPLWESVVECIMKYESWHGPEHYPYVAFGHRIRPGERFPSRLTRKEGEQLLRKDLKELCALFRHLGKDSLIIACLAYQVGPYRLLGYGKMPKSTLVRKLESGNRDIYADFVKYCHYKGKKIPSIERRRKEEYERLFVP